MNTSSRLQIGVRTKLLLTLLVGFASAPLWALPTISGVAGTIEHGAAVTIQGSGFGNKTSPKPLVWDDFESGQSGNVIAGNAPAASSISPTWKWDEYSQYPVNRPRYSNEVTRPKSSISSKHSFPANGGYNSSLEIYRNFQNAGDEVYFTFWWRYKRDGSNWSRNVKPWIEYGSDGVMPMAYIGWGNPSLGDGGLRNSVQDTNLSGLNTLWGGHDINTVENEWVRIEVYLKQSTPGGNDGAFQTWLHRTNSPSIKVAHGSTNYRTRNSSKHWYQWHFGSYHDTDNSGGTVFIDDLYFDSSRARVELGNAASWNQCTRREIQIPTGWTGDNIGVMLNTGVFQPGESLYVFVVDGQGNVSSGYPITIGGSAAEPMAPVNVKVE